jgi:outer membrane protein OmpA-like peptidoglycan-associated protein
MTPLRFPAALLAAAPLACICALAACTTPHSQPTPSKAVAEARAHKDVTPEATCPALEPTASIGFPFENATIPDTAMPALEQATRMLACHPQVRAVVVGEADSHGTDAEQKKLSQSRIDAVISYLTTHGIAATRLTQQLEGKAPTPGDQQVVIMAEGRRW